MNVLFVCLGNICRSPMAEATFRDLASNEGLRGFEVASAGIHALNGAGVPEILRELLLRRGIDLSTHRGRQLDRTLAEWADCILVMDSYQMGVVESLFPQTRGKVALLPEFSPGGGSEVADPFGGDEGDYAACLAQIEEGVRGVMEVLRHRGGRHIARDCPRAV